MQMLDISTLVAQAMGPLRPHIEQAAKAYVAKAVQDAIWTELGAELASTLGLSPAEVMRLLRQSAAHKQRTAAAAPPDNGTAHMMITHHTTKQETKQETCAISEDIDAPERGVYHRGPVRENGIPAREHIDAQSARAAGETAEDEDEDENELGYPRHKKIDAHKALGPEQAAVTVTSRPSAPGGTADHTSDEGDASREDLASMGDPAGKDRPISQVGLTSAGGSLYLKDSIWAHKKAGALRAPDAQQAIMTVQGTADKEALPLQNSQHKFLEKQTSGTHNGEGPAPELARAGRLLEMARLRHIQVAQSHTLFKQEVAGRHGGDDIQNDAAWGKEAEPGFAEPKTARTQQKDL